MKKILLIQCFCLLLINIGCVQKSKHEKVLKDIDSLLSENNRLVSENEELRTGESRLIDLIEYSISNQKYINAKKYIKQLQEKHPQSSKLIGINELVQSINEKANMEQQIIDKALSDSIRLANINETGIWETGTYVNEFNKETGEKYVVGEVYGTFSNTATEKSPLRVQFYTGKPNEINMRIFEYNGNNPKKSGYTKKYLIVATSEDGNKYGYEAKLGASGVMGIYKTDIVAYDNDYLEIYELFKTYKRYSFYMEELQNLTNTYKWELNPSFFENALLKAGIESL